LEHRVPDALRIAPIRHRCRKPPAHPELALHRTQQQQTAIRRLIATSKINCEFLAPDRWKLEGKQRIVAHGGFGGGLIHIAHMIRIRSSSVAAENCDSEIDLVDCSTTCLAVGASRPPDDFCSFDRAFAAPSWFQYPVVRDVAQR